jgi:hypothetical protein
VNQKVNSFVKKILSILALSLCLLVLVEIVSWHQERRIVHAQQQQFGSVITMLSGAPNPVTQVGAAFVGTAGPGGTFFYWVVANYPIGAAPPLAPAVVTNVPNLGGGNSVAISWTTVGATNYDVLRSTTNAFPGSCAACRVAAAVVGSSATDTGAALGAYTLGSAPSPVQGHIELNNQDFTAPRFRVDRAFQVTVTGFIFPDGTTQTTAAAPAAGTLGDPGANGIVVRTAAGAPATSVARSIAVSPPIVIVNPDGVAGNPSLSCAICVTSAGALTLSALVLGAGGQGTAVLASLGTTTTVLHGNAAGAPSFAAVSLATDVSGTVQATNFPALTGDITTPGGSLATTLASSGVVAGTYTKVTVDAKGRATVGATATLASADFANQGTTTTLLHGNAAGNPSFAAIATADAGANVNGNGTKFQLFTGAAPAANDCAKFDVNGNIVTAGAACASAGVSISGAVTSGDVPFASNATTLTIPTGHNLFWDDTNQRLGINLGASPLATLHLKYKTANTTSNTPLLRLDNSSATGVTTLAFYSNSGVTIRSTFGFESNAGTNVLGLDSTGLLITGADGTGASTGPINLNTTADINTRSNVLYVSGTANNSSISINGAGQNNADLQINSISARDILRLVNTTTKFAVANTGLAAVVGLGSTATGGTKFTISGCTAGTTVGGATAGTYTSGTTGTCTVVITMNGATGLTAPNGWSCAASDLTTPADTQTQSASTTTTATITGTTITGDVIAFHCMGY